MNLSRPGVDNATAANPAGKTDFQRETVDDVQRRRDLREDLARKNGCHLDTQTIAKDNVALNGHCEAAVATFGPNGAQIKKTDTYMESRPRYRFDKDDKTVENGKINWVYNSAKTMTARTEEGIKDIYTKEETVFVTILTEELDKRYENLETHGCFTQMN